MQRPSYVASSYGPSFMINYDNNCNKKCCRHGMTGPTGPAGSGGGGTGSFSGTGYTGPTGPAGPAGSGGGVDSTYKLFIYYTTPSSAAINAGMNIANVTHNLPSPLFDLSWINQTIYIKNTNVITSSNSYKLLPNQTTCFYAIAGGAETIALWENNRAWAANNGITGKLTVTATSGVGGSQTLNITASFGTSGITGIGPINLNGDGQPHNLAVLVLTFDSSIV